MLRKQTSANDPADWFAFAAERIHSADVLHTHEGLTASGIETLQEGVERYLKGYLIARGWELIKTHDLEFLLREAVTFDPAFKSFFAMAEELTEDFFTQHYPGANTSELGQNYDSLRAQAGEMIALIQRTLPAYFTDTKTK